MTAREIFTYGPFKGVDVQDCFARAALARSGVVAGLQAPSASFLRG